MQIYFEAMIFCKFYTNSKVDCKYINKGMIESLISNIENFLIKNNILICTPMRAKEILLIQDKKLLESIEFLVFDEADKFFDFGFIEIVDEILFLLKDLHIKKLFLSATLFECKF
jgi:ATP-dependent RNA helicase DDX54/DBP10